MKIFKIIFLFLILGSFITCSSDNLDVEPVNEFLSENFYQTDDQVYNALIAAYDPIGWTMAFGNWISEVMFNEIRSDNANAGGDPSDNDQPGWQEFDDFRNTNTNTVILPMYRRFYIGIFRANLVILKPEFTSPQVDVYQAEAKFLRAYYHFELFKHFGPIPVVQELLTPEDTDLSRNTMTEVFTAIEADLLDAINVLPISVSSSQTGRATKGSAQALLGKVYMYWADLDNDNTAIFDAAANQLNAVVESGAYSLVDDYSALYGFGFKNSSESVFEIQKSNLWPSDFGWFEGIEGNGIIQLCGIRGLCEEHPDYQAGWGFMLPTPGLYNSYLSDDTYRRDASIVSEAQLEQEVLDAGASCDVVVDPTQSNPQDFTGFWQIKASNFKSYVGNNVNGGDPNLTKDANIYSIRYADVLLMLAESLVRGTGSESEAMDYIDQVRERAAGPGDNSGSFRTSQQLMSDQGWSLLEVLRYERRAEFALEGDRWFDLVRSGRASSSLFAGDNIRENNFDINKHLWLPIALSETTVATNLTEYPDASLFQ